MTIDKALYTPTATDLDWAREMMRVTRDGGVLCFPSAQLTYRVDHAARTLRLQNPDRLSQYFDSFVTHNQTIIVFRAIGYTVEESQSDKGDGDMEVA